MILKRRPPWKEKEMLFTSVNITVYEEKLAIDVKTWIPIPGKTKFKPRALRRGKVIWIIKDGVVLNEKEEKEL